MTYCLAMRLDDGIVLLSDTRTNAGVDNVSTYRKLHVLRPAPDRLFVLQSAGNLATTQEVLDRIDRELADRGAGPNLATVDRLFEAALYVGRLSRTVAEEHRDALQAVGADGTASFILGGQIAGEAPDVFLIYPEGNYIRASDEKPFLQIGESKYGKHELEIGISAKGDLETAVKIALSSMMSTARANLSVGPPYDLAIYRPDSFDVDEARIDEDSPYLAQLHDVWQRILLDAIGELPPVPPEVFTRQVLR
jgi:putative proteasome-type protease